MSYSERERNSVQRKMLRFIWVYAGRLSRWAGKRIVARAVAADKMDHQ